MSWEVGVKKEVMLRYSKGKWKNGTGEVVAEEAHVPGQRDFLKITGEDLEVNMKDLIVAAWTTRIWQGNGRISLARSLMRGHVRVRRWRAFRDG